MDTLGPRIKQLRMEAGLSKAALARRVGVSDVTISYWESGTIKQIGHERLLSLAEALECPLERLLDNNTPTHHEFEGELAHASILALHSASPPPWERHSLAPVASAPGSALSELLQGCYLVTPADGETFAHLGTGDIAAVFPTSHFDEEGLYLLQWRNTLVIQQLSRLPSGALSMDGEPPSETLPPQSLCIIGRIRARWQQRRDNE
ncbi:helix-turn-helix transcriptional regulator [Chromohalobacter salexigens]